MSEKPIRVVLMGFGVMGQGVLRLASTRPQLQVAGVIVRRDELDGLAAREVVAEAPPELRLRVDGEQVLQETRPDVVLVATRSSLRDVLPHLRLAAAAGTTIACTAEEMGYLRPEDGPEAAAIHQLAAQSQVAIVGLGMNPGFLLDVWPLSLASLAHDIESMDCLRVVDVSAYGPRVRGSLGIGYTAEEFERELGAGRIRGHIGFRESLRLVGDAVGQPIDDTVVETRPIFAQRDRILPDGQHVAAGQSVGARQLASGSSGGRTWLRVEMAVTVALDELGVEAVDRVHIAGTYELSASISPGASSVTGTIGRIVNALPAVARMPPGVHTSLELGVTPAPAGGAPR